MNRENCPKENIGRVFGSINTTGKLEGSILSPNYCIVDESGQCIRHNAGERDPK